jgi:hypothetical protein
MLDAAGDAEMSYQGPERPTALEVGASLLAIVGIFCVGRVAYGVVVNLGEEQWSSGARAMFLFLNSIVLIFSLFVLVLAHQVRRGRQWAWIAALIMLPFTTLFGALMVLITAVGGSFPFAGAGVVVSSLAALLARVGVGSPTGSLRQRPPEARAQVRIQPGRGCDISRHRDPSTHGCRFRGPSFRGGSGCSRRVWSRREEFAVGVVSAASSLAIRSHVVVSGL